MLTPMPVIVGAPRSGTTLLRFILDAHPDLAIPPETGFLLLGPQFESRGDALREEFFRKVTNYPPEAPGWMDFHLREDLFLKALSELDPFTVPEGYRAFYRLYAERFNKKRWGDKTPKYCFTMDDIERILPEAHFIHIIRDGRDSSLSLRRMWFSPGWDIEIQARHWSKFVKAARDGGSRCSHYFEIHYEDLILNTKETINKICDFIELDFNETMLRYYEQTPARLKEHRGRSRPDGTLLLTDQQRIAQQIKTTEPPDADYVFKWKTIMSYEERSLFEKAGGDLLRELGYETLQT